jgi:Phage-related replication protein
VSRPTVAVQQVANTGTGHLTELLYDDGTNSETLICAAHAGDVEPGTGEQALELAVRLGATCWACFGYDQTGAFEAFHPPSSGISPAEYPLLGEIADREFERVVSLHGLGDDRVLVGGGVDGRVKQQVSDRLDGALTVDVEPVSSGQYAGVSPENFVNWLAADGGGLQLEQGTRARVEESGATLDTLAGAVRDDVL